MLQMFYVFARP